MGKELIPQPTWDTKEFWEGCKEKLLKFQKCKVCGYVRWPPSNLCPQCHSFETEWITSSGKGKIYSYVVYHVAFHPYWKDKTPYVVAVVELEEGVRIPTNIVGVSVDALKCDMPVEVVWDRLEEYFIPRFRPSKD